VTDARSGGGPWRDRTIVVTGGTSGIGRQFAIRFAAEGAKVIACGRNDMALRKLQTEYPMIEAVQRDITGRPNVLALVETIRDHYGMLDVLVKNVDHARNRRVSLVFHPEQV
jgi:short-subunit dehydrogenase involved in D-alanine esterification of teichoic acids